MEINRKTILFYCAISPTVMIYKMAKILKERGYKTILLTMCEKDNFDYSFYKKAFNKIICSNFQFFKFNFKNIPYIIKRGPSLIKFLIYMKLLKSDVWVGMAGGNWQLKLSHKYFLNKSPFIYFPYDILCQFFSNLEEAIKKGPPKFELKAEKYCFENSNGIIHKGGKDELELIKGRVYKNIDISKKQLHFLPYCSKEFIVPINKNKLSKKDKEIHIVYLGYFSNEPHYLKQLLSIFKSILDQKIHLHIYSTTGHLPKKEIKKYTQNLFKQILNNQYFHIHKPLNANEIILDTSKYNFGFFDAYETDTNEDLIIKFSTGNKIASYFEAGIPIIYDEKCQVLGEIMKQYKTGISFNNENIKNLKKRIKKINYLQIEKNVILARKDFDMDKNFPKLEKFINEIINKK